MHDLVIHSGAVVDGRPATGDAAVDGGVIRLIGDRRGRGRRSSPALLAAE